MKRTALITYVHKALLGTVGEIQGEIKAVWTIGHNGKKLTRETIFDDEKFATLWNGINDIETFCRYRVNNPNARLDFDTNHVISVTFELDNQQKLLIFLVPTEENAPDFLEWLRLLGVPDANLFE